MLVKGRGSWGCLKPGRASGGTVPAAHAALLTRRHPDRQQPCCSRAAGSGQGLSEAQTSKYVWWGGCIWACVNDVDKAPPGDRSRPPPSLFFLTLARVWAPAARGGNLCQGTGLSWYARHAVPQTGDAREGVQPRQKSTRIFPHECSPVQTQMILSSAKGLLILPGFCLAFLSYCGYSPLPDPIVGLM